MKFKIVLALSLTTFFVANTGGITPWEHGPWAAPTYSGFTEIRGEKTRFLVVGDTQRTSHWEFWRERNDKERKYIADEITRRDPAFVLHLGDLTTRGASEKHWQEFDRIHKTFCEKRIPYFPILGNHEFYGSHRKALRNYFQRFPHLGRKRWYSFTWKNLAILMVDSNFSTLTKQQIEQQDRWYSRELEKFETKPEIDFVIVCCHEPPFTNNRTIGPNKNVRGMFAEPFLRLKKTRLFLSGHSHSYERFQTGNKFFVVSGGGGGPRHLVTIDSRKQRRPDLFSGSELRFFHLCEIENRGQSLAFRALRLESNKTFTIADAFAISKISE